MVINKLYMKGRLKKLISKCLLNTLKCQQKLYPSLLKYLKCLAFHCSRNIRILRIFTDFACKVTVKKQICWETLAFKVVCRQAQLSWRILNVATSLMSHVSAPWSRCVLVSTINNNISVICSLETDNVNCCWLPNYLINSANKTKHDLDYPC